MLLVGPLLVSSAAAQASPPPVKLTDWPTLKDPEKARVVALIGQFRKPEVKLHAEAKSGLLQLGAGAAPQILLQVSDRADNTNVALFAVLDEMLTPAHSALMAREAQKPRVELRRYLVHRLCRFGEPDLAPLFETMQKDKDEATAFYAALGLLAQKRREPVPAVLAYCKAHWTEVGKLVAEVLAPARSAACATFVFEAIAKANAADQMTGLRLLRYLMVKEQGVILRTYLEASDHAVKREAVNAARVVHGEEAIDGLSVFQAIEHAKDWLKKL